MNNSEWKLQEKEFQLERLELFLHSPVTAARNSSLIKESTNTHAYKVQAVKKLEAQLVYFQKQQFSLNEKLTFQANEIYEKDEKLKRYRRIGMKAVKEKEQLQKIVDSWKDSSKNLWRLIDSGMSSNSKVGLGFEIKSNNEKGPQKPKISVSYDNSSKHSTCQSNDSEGSYGNTSEHSFEIESESLSEPNEMSKFNKMARKAEVKRVVSTGNGVAKPVWTNANRINHANKLVPRSVQLNTGRTNINSVRPKVNAVSPKINSVRPKVNAVSPKVNTVRPRQLAPHKTSNSLSPKRPQMNQINQRRDFSKSYSSTFSKVIIGELKNDYLNNNIGPTFIRTENANVPQADPSLQRPSKQGDQSKDFEEFKDKGDLLPFGGIKGYISGKGRIRSRFYELNALSMEKQANPHAVCFKSNKQCRLLKKKLNQGHLHTNQRKRRTLTEPPKRDERILYYPLEDNPKIQAFRSRLEESPKAFRDSPENNTTSTLQLILVVRQLILEVPKKDVLKLYSHARRTVTAQATQEEGIDYEEVFAPVARKEAIPLFFAFASNIVDQSNSQDVLHINAVKGFFKYLKGYEDCEDQMGPQSFTTAHLCAIDKDCEDFEDPILALEQPISAIVHTKPTS
ncbi:hypothetical protein Tco_0070810 [Tanacetum coccineum]